MPDAFALLPKRQADAAQLKFPCQLNSMLPAQCFPHPRLCTVDREGEQSSQRGLVPYKHSHAKEKPALKWYLNDLQQGKKISMSS
jgi:hypothetical protein